jgi:predicted GNAT family acetyltransferase
LSASDIASDETSVEVRDNQTRSRFEILVDGVPAGFAQYRLREGSITFTHTVIDQEYEGQGLGGQLARSALDNVRGRGLTVRPLCPFIARYIRRHPEYVDIVDPEFLAKW